MITPSPAEPAKSTSTVIGNATRTSPVSSQGLSQPQLLLSFFLFFLRRLNLHTTWREFLREILYKNIAIIAIQHGKYILLTPLAIFPILLGEIHSSPSGKFPYTY